MTPEERELVRGLFDRLADLERERRDPDAERLIREGLARAPNATYAMVQTVLLQDEALRAANARIEELQRSLADTQSAGGEGSQGGGFLSPQRGKWNTGGVLGAPARQEMGAGPAGERPGGLPPSFGSSDRPMGVPPGFGGNRGYPGDAYREPPMPQGQGGSPYGGPPYGGSGGPSGGPGGAPGGSASGGSFLGTAAAIAAGAIGGGLLMGGIKSALGGAGASSGSGGATKSPFADAFEQMTGKGGSSGSSGDLSRDAGLGDIGRSPRQGAMSEQAAKTANDDNAGFSEDNYEHGESDESEDSEEGDFEEDSFEDQEDE